MNKLYHLLAICVIAVWGTTFVNTKVLLQHGLTPAEIFLLRFIIAYLCIWFISPKKLWADNLKDELWLMALGVSGGSLYFLTENTALQLSFVNNVAFLVCTAPLITTLLAIALYKDVKATRPLIIGSLLALIGVAIVIFNGHFVLKLNPLGDILALSAALCWAVYSIIIKKISTRYSATFITRKVFVYGIITILPYFTIQPWNFPMERLHETTIWGNLLFLAVVASFVCFLLWSLIIKKIGALKSSNYIYLNPVTTVAASAVILNEPMTTMAYIGSALILVGVYIANQAKGI